MNKKIGFLFGDFDPIFTEQIEMCEDIIHEFGLDKVMLAPFSFPKRSSEQMTTYIDNRKDMIKLATWHNRSVQIMDDYEVPDVRLPTQLDILKKLEAKYNAEVYYIMTSNHFVVMPQKEGFENFVRGRNIIVAVRPHFSRELNSMASSISAKHDANISLSTTPRTVLSSMIIRAYIQMGVINETLLPFNVIEYINKNLLYKMHSRLFEKVRTLEPAPVYAHTVATCLNCIELAQVMKLNQSSALLAGLLHNIGKCYTIKKLEELGVFIPDSYRTADIMSMHGHLGELAAKYFMGITDPEILDAIKHHSTGRANMNPFELLLFTASSLAAGHNSENYENVKYRFFESPRQMFIDMLDKKYRDAKQEMPLSGFPKNLKEAYLFYRRKKNLASIFSEFFPSGN